MLGQLYRSVRQQAAQAKRELLALSAGADTGGGGTAAQLGGSSGSGGSGGSASYDPDFECGLGTEEFEEELQAALVSGWLSGCAYIECVTSDIA